MNATLTHAADQICLNMQALRAVGFEPSASSLHESTDCRAQQSLMHVLQEPFRWIANVTVMEVFESRTLDLPDFYFTRDDSRAGA